MQKRPQTRGEELANSLSHGAGLLGALACLPWLVSSASRLHTINVVASLVFGVTMVLLYLCSTLYHALPPGAGKRLLHRLDHSAIYLFIAGSYTPFALGALGGAWGWTLFGLVWAMAATGILLKSVNRLMRPAWSTGLYLAMGWLVLVAAVPLVKAVPWNGVLWLVAGGLAYTVGVVFYALSSRIRYMHAVWHGFVVLGTACHVVAVLNYAG